MLGSDDTPRLSFALSDVDEDVDVRERSDIDSTIIELSSLAAVKSGGLGLAYHPLYQASVREPLRFRTREPGTARVREPLHKMKNVLIGEPSGWIRGSRINVFFPHMPLAKSTSEQYLSEVELRDWVDRILLPSLHASVGADVAHHHPRSWAAALADSKVRQELNPRSHSANMANKHNVPCEHLGRLWDEIRQRCDSLQIGPRKPFKAPVLLLYQHGSKGLYKADSVRAAMRKYRRELEAAYDLRHFAASAYFDIGTEYFSEQAVTLLWKTQCIEKMRDTIQATAVKVGDGTTRISTWDQYLWCLCADAATVQYTISGSSMLFRSGLAHAQVYNIDKNIFSTQIKNYGPFGAKQLHRLGLADDAKHGHQKGYRSKTKLQFSQQEIAKSCIQTAQRVFKQLESTRDGSYGVRQEVRVSLRKAFEWLDRQPDGDEKEAAPVTPADGEHRAFWVLRTDEVSRFRLRA
ncbi:MAG TPA: hypothetical protein VHW01_19720, partial [Polyangiaceae bacterium]|nr:hypothetical protein [Polyangiaceae bacterium]